MSRKRHDCGWAERAAITVSGSNWDWVWQSEAGRAYREYERARYWVFHHCMLAHGRKRICERRLIQAADWLESAQRWFSRVKEYKEDHGHDV